MSKQDFKEKVILVTSGGTREPIDPVRFISNASSGKMGLALAEAAHSRKGKVIFITASRNYPEKLPFKTIPVSSAREMFKEVRLSYLKADIIIMAAAVADFRPAKVRMSKIKKEKRTRISLNLVKNPDILAWLGKKKGKRILVGFCAETGNVESRARKKLIEKNADLFVGVNLRQSGGVVGKDFARFKLVEKGGRITSIPRRRKKALANLILDKVSSVKS